MFDAGLARLLNALPGRRITRLIFARFVAKGRPISLDEIGFELDGAPAGKISGAPDGESLRYSSEPAAPLVIGEYGERKLFDHLDGVDLGKVAGTTISGVDLILDGEVVIGIVLKLDNGSELLILNCGDDLVALLAGDHAMLREPNVTRRSFA